MAERIKITPLQRFFRLLKPDRREITNVYVYAVFHGLVNLSLPLGIQAIVNFIQAGQPSTSWGVLVVVVVLGVGFSGVLQIMQLKITENLQQKIFARASMEFAYRIPKIRLDALYRHYAPELANRFFDTVSVQKGVSKMLIDFSSAALQVGFGLLLLAVYHPFFILFGFLLLGLLYAIFFFTGNIGLKTSLKESKYKYEVAHWLEELARTQSSFKLAGRTELPLEKADKLVGNYLGARDSHFKILLNQYSMLVVFKVLVATGLLAIGGVLVMQQQMNIGQFVAAEIIILMVMTSVEKVILSLDTIYDVLTSLEKIAQVTDLELEATTGVGLDESTNQGLSIVLDNLTFAYPDNPQNTIDGLSMEFPAGEKWLITGGSESGKSTLLHLLAGLYCIKTGVIKYDRASLASINPTSLRSVIGDCLNQELLFEGTIYENITMGREKCTPENVEWAIKNLKVEAYLKELPEGLETRIDTEGKKLPKSVVQKILLARSIVDKPRLLLLEESFAHINTEDRNDVIDFLTHKDNPWTLVAVSNNAYLGKKCDKVAFLNKGKLVRTGTYEDIIGLNE